MPKRILFVLLLFFWAVTFSQKPFKISIKLGGLINPKNISFSYYTGKETKFIPDTFISKSIHLEGEFYSEKLVLSVFYKDSIYYGSFFFIDTLPAKIVLSFSPGLKGPSFHHKYIENATPVFDTSNIIYAKIALTGAEYNKKIHSFKVNYWKNIREKQPDDTLYASYLKLIKDQNVQYLKILREYSHDYFSFWYFKEQILFPALSNFKKGDVYIEQLLDSMYLIFPARVTKSIEGRMISETATRFIETFPTIGDKVPTFSFKDIHNNENNSRVLSKKYILLDFWATWCGPCMKDIPFIKEIWENFSRNKLTLISISADRDSTQFAKVIAQNRMTWTHVLDKENVMVNTFNVTEFPTLILIDENGRVIFRSRVNNGDNSQLMNILRDIKSKE